VTPEEADKMSEDKTKQELEKLYQTIKEKGSQFENNFKTPSDIEGTDQNWSSESETDSESDREYERKPRRKTRGSGIDNRMYNDNQKLWKKIQKLEIAVAKSDKELRYLKYEYNNKCIDITKLESKNSKLDDVIKKQVTHSEDTDKNIKRMNERHLKDTTLLLCCYLYMFMMLVNYKFEVPIFDYGYTTVRETVSFLFSTTRTVEDKMFLINNGSTAHNNL
jgi:hypothetical protein